MQFRLCFACSYASLSVADAFFASVAFFNESWAAIASRTEQMYLKNKYVVTARRVLGHGAMGYRLCATVHGAVGYGPRGYGLRATELWAVGYGLRAMGYGPRGYGL